MAVSWPGVHTYHYAVDLSPRLTTHCPLLPLLSTLARFFCGSICRQDTRRRCLFWASCIITLHNVLFGQYVYLATEQAETYLKICVLIYHLTYICPSLFDCKVNTFFFIFVNCETLNLKYPPYYSPCVHYRAIAYIHRGPVSTAWAT